MTLEDIDSLGLCAAAWALEAYQGCLEVNCMTYSCEQLEPLQLIAVRERVIW